MYGLLDNNGVVIQVQPMEDDGFVELPDNAVCGMVFSDGELTTPDIIYDWDVVRAKRNSLLSKSDWTQVEDSPLSTEQKSLWAAYRQTLRDITEIETPNEAMHVLQSLTKPQ